MQPSGRSCELLVVFVARDGSLFRFLPVDGNLNERDGTMYFKNRTWRHPRLRGQIGSFGFILILMCFFGCKEGPDATATAAVRSVPAAEEDVILIPSPHAVPRPTGGLAEAISVLRAMHDEGITIGRESGGKSEMFGEVTDVARAPGGKVYVLDALNGTIKIYDRQARFEGSFGRPGNGPNELFYPVALDLSGDSLLLVAQKNRVVKTFRIDDAPRIEETASFTLDFNPEDLCLMNDEIYVRGYRADPAGSGSVIHVYDLQGEEIRAFGEPYETDHAMMQRLLSAGGSVVCQASERVVVTSYKYLPFIRAYTTSGERAWSARFADFQQVNARMARSPSGSEELRFGRPVAGMDFVQALAALPEGLLLVQVLEIVEAGEPLIHSFLIDPAGKSAAYAGSALWPVRGAGGNSVFFATGTPYPRIRFSPRTKP